MAVDDLHRLDPPSAQAILFAARRLWREGIAMLLTARPEDLAPGDLEGIDRIEVTPLGRRESGHLARRVAGRGLNDEDVEALFIGTGGNPLAIIEATRSLGDAGDALAGVILPLPVADRIRAGVERRLAAPGPAEQAAVLTEAAGTEAPGLLRLCGGTVAFEHPLTRSAVYATAAGAEQRQAHRALAEVSPVGSPERAWHLRPPPPAPMRTRPPPSRAGERMPWRAERRARPCARSTGPPPSARAPTSRPGASCGAPEPPASPG